MAKKILIVDDEVDLLKLVTYRLKKLGYDILTAVNGEDALKTIRENKPDLIILDLILPLIDGYEVARKLKADNELKIIPIILLTASCTGDMNNKLKNTQANDYLIKPFEPDALLNKVTKLLEA